jgi:hypothetical protein
MAHKILGVSARASQQLNCLGLSPEVKGAGRSHGYTRVWQHPGHVSWSVIAPILHDQNKSLFFLALSYLSEATMHHPEGHYNWNLVHNHPADVWPPLLQKKNCQIHRSTARFRHHYTGLFEWTNYSTFADSSWLLSEGRWPGTSSIPSYRDNG